MADSRSVSLPIKLIAQYALTMLSLWLIVHFLPQFLMIDGSWAALPTVAALLMLLNIFARPVLKILTFPLKLFMTIVAIVLANGLFLWLLQRIAEEFDPRTAVILVDGGWGGWIVVALLLGLANWLIHHSIR